MKKQKQPPKKKESDLSKLESDVAKTNPDFVAWLKSKKRPTS